MRTTLYLIACVVLVQQAIAADAPCGGTPAGNGVVASVTDGRTLKLADGREVRLASLDAPSDGNALRNLTLRQALRLERVADDRYGRLVAYAYREGDEKPLQFTLLEAGQARVSARVGSKTCADALLAAEREARSAKRGLWADPNFAPLAAENLAGLGAARGHFALVEGQVLSVRESGATIYVNFGRRWTRDFTVTILKRQKRSFAAAGIDVDRLQGQRIRVRGMIEQRGGPIVEVLAPEQIETID
jgi:endonuclease YncB( thermonuclease family)